VEIGQHFLAGNSRQFLMMMMSDLQSAGIMYHLQANRKSRLSSRIIASRDGTEK